MVRYRLIGFVTMMLLTSGSGRCLAEAADMQWDRLPDLPDTTGFAGAFAGVSNGALIVAGGTNFAEVAPGGKVQKTWYDSVYVLESPDGKWKTGYSLPRTLAYGVSIVTPRGLVCIGGCDKEKNYRDVYLVRWEGDGIRVSELPALPKPVSSASGALVEETIYIAGGQPGPNPFSGPSMRNFWALDLGDPSARWQQLDPWPGPERFYAVAATDGKSFYLISGLRRVVDENGKPQLEFLTDAYRYDVPTGEGAGSWHRLADLPRPNAAAATPAPVVAGRVLLLGNGADGSNLEIPSAERPGFGDEILAYDIQTDRWLSAGRVPAGRAAVTAVRWGDSWVLPTGEVRPAVRSPQVYTARIAE
jgi:N-acetylneuraminate epimerase